VRPILIVMAAVMSVSVVLAVRAARLDAPDAAAAIERPPSMPAVTEQQPPEKAVVGTLESVSAGAAQIVVNTTSGKQTFAVESGAMVRQGSRTIKTSELPSHKGERVKVRYRESGGVKRAAWIVLAAPASSQKKKSPAPPHPPSA
jgi:hypothetical protein